MAPLTRTAAFARFVCLLLCALATRGTMSADSGAASRYAMAPGDPTSAPSDPTLAPGDPTMAPGDPRDAAQPRDMTNPRAFRRAQRGRFRDRIAPDAPVTNVRPLRDFMNPPIASDWPAQRRPLETQAPPAPVENRPQPVRAQALRVAPPEPAPAPVQPVEIVRSAPPAPVETIEPEVVQTEVTATPIQLAESQPVPLPAPPADPISDAPRSVDQSAPKAPLIVDEQRVHTLNKPIHQIALVEPIDEEGLRPADVSSELGLEGKPIMLAGSMFWIAHPARYLYCFSHNPLYFEDANLERCGIGHGCCQPVCSAAKFVGQAALLPYSVLVNPPCSCETTLGDCPTCHAYPWGVDINH